MVQTAVYVGIVLGAIVMLCISVAILYNEHRKEMSKIQALEEANARVAQERMRRVLGE